MSRYFIEIAYKGTNYSGSQIQENANTVQSKIEKAFNIIHGLQTHPSLQGEGREVRLTGSSRTDAGVHALQNFFHFDYEDEIHPQFIYKMNALLPQDIVVKEIIPMPPFAHSRFDAKSREYIYYIHRFKDPFLQSTSLYFPYKLDIELMKQAAEYLKQQTNFFAFSKTNTQVKNFSCRIIQSAWIAEENTLAFNIEANRFLRGMVRSVTATLLKIGRHKLSIQDFEKLFTKETKSGYSVSAHGLFLTRVNYPENYFLH